ncbi:MAG: hypothetical protein QOF26_2435 [Baekduia sp.]|nr:hypothetical protein [Baekduia sp.]
MARFAAHQHGVVGLAELRAARLTGRAITRRVAAGRLHRLFPGVYAVGHPRLTPDGRRYAAVRACGPGARASHLMASALWGLRASAKLEVTVPGRRRGPREVVVHETRVLGEAHIAVVRNIPVTSLARTLADLADVLAEDRLERVLDHAGRHSAFDRRQVEAVLDDLPGRHGAPLLRAMLGTPSAGMTRSALEDAFLALCRRGALPVPRLNTHIAVGPRLVEADALFADAQVVVELDGAQTHDSTPAFHADRRRDTALAALGFQTLRYTWDRVTGEPEAVTAELRAVLTRRLPAGR